MWKNFFPEYKIQARLRVKVLCFLLSAAVITWSDIPPVKSDSTICSHLLVNSTSRLAGSPNAPAGRVSAVGKGSTAIFQGIFEEGNT